MTRSKPKRRRDPSYTARRLRRRAWVRAIVGVVALILALSAALDRLGTFGFEGNDWATFDHKTYRVARVVDGDTVVIVPAAGGKETRVRLLGIDAAEMNHESDRPPEFWAQQATDYVRKRAENRDVIVQLEATETRDRYDRLLAYLYLSETENLNLTLVRDGHVYADRRFRHSLRPQFELVESEARRKGRGLWDDVAEHQMPEWRQRWLQEQRDVERLSVD